MFTSLSSERQGVIEVLLGGILWGTIGVFVLLMDRYGSTTPLTCFLRMFFAFLLLLFLTVVQFGWSAFRIDRRSLVACLFLGFLCQGLYNIFYNEAILSLGMTVSAVLLNLAPLCGMLASRLLFHETVTFYKLTGLLLCMAGCFLTVTGGTLQIATIPVGGLLYGIGAGLTYGLTSVFGRLAGFRCNAWVMSTYSYFFATLALGLFSSPFDGVSVTFPLLSIGFLYALIPTALGYLFYYWGVQKITENSKVPVIASIETVVSALFGIFLFQESLDFMHILGIVMVLVSIAVMNRKSSC